MINIAEFPK